jgi:hypothetical protein
MPLFDVSSVTRPRPALPRREFSAGDLSGTADETVEGELNFLIKLRHFFDSR